MNRRIAAAAMVAFLVGAPAIGISQMSFGGLGSKLGGGGGSGGDLTVQQTQLVESYVSAGKDVLSSQAKLLEALGLKEEALKLQATADALPKGPTKDALEAADKAISGSTKLMEGFLKTAGAPPTAESRKAYAVGLLLLASGLLKYTSMKDSVASFSKSLSGPAALKAATQLESGVYIVKTLPDSISNTSATLNSAVAYARSHGIEVPKDATAAL